MCKDQKTDVEEGVHQHSCERRDLRMTEFIGVVEQSMTLQQQYLIADRLFKKLQENGGDETALTECLTIMNTMSNRINAEGIFSKNEEFEVTMNFRFIS